MAPAYAIPRLLARHGLMLTDIDLWEIHEAFAAQVHCNIAAIENESFLREKVNVNHPLGKFPWERLNPNGGSVAILSAQPAHASCRKPQKNSPRWVQAKKPSSVFAQMAGWGRWRCWRVFSFLMAVDSLRKRHSARCMRRHGEKKVD